MIEARSSSDAALLLWVGELSEARRRALEEVGLSPRTVSVERAADEARQQAPDAIVIGPEAGAATGAVSESSPWAPLLTLAPDGDGKPRARFGASTELRANLEPAALARQLATLTRGLVRRAPRWRLSAPPGALGTLLTKVGAGARSGLIVTGARAMAITATGPVEVEAMRAAVGDSATVSLVLHERPAHTIAKTGTDPERPATRLEGCRALVVVSEPARARLVARSLDARGADTRVIAPQGPALEKARSLDPELVVVDAAALRSGAIAPLWVDARLASAPLLVLEPEGDDARVDALAAALTSEARAIGRRLASGEALASRLEVLGAARWVKALARAAGGAELRVRASTGRGVVALDGGKVSTARFLPRDDREPPREGRAAVEALMGIASARIIAGTKAAIARLEVSGDGWLPAIPAPPVSLGDLADDDLDLPTRSYELAEAEKLRAALSEPPAGRSEDETPVALRDEAPPKRPPPLFSVPRPGVIAQSAEPEAAGPPELPRPTSPSEPSTAEEGGGSEASASEAAAPETPRMESGAARAESSAQPAETTLPAEKREADAIRDVGEPSTKAGAPTGETEAGGEEVVESAKPEASVPRGGQEHRRRGGLGWALGALFVVGLVAAGVYLLGWSQPSESALVAAEASGPGPEPSPPSAPEGDTPSAARVEVDAEEPDLMGARDDSMTIVSEEADDSITSISDEANDDSLTSVSDDVDDSMTSVSEDAVGAASDPPPSTEGIAEVATLIAAAQQATAERRYDEAEALARRAIAAAPESGDAAYRLALVHLRRREYEEAMVWAARAQTLSPTDPLPFSLEGDIAAASGQFRRAARAYQRALEIEPRFGPATRRLEGLRARGIEN